MQQELIEMLDKMIKHFEYISTDSYYAKETGTILSEAEKLVEKAKSNNAPAVPQGEPVAAWLKAKIEKHALLAADCPGSSSVVLKSALLRFLDRLPPVAATPAPAPAPAQERCSTCGYLTSEREHLGCLRRAVKDLDIATGGPHDAQEVVLTDEERADMACAVAAICTGTSSRTVAATAIEWTERALRAKEKK